MAKGKGPARRSGGKGPNRKGYDVAMIRDFLEHLEWEMRIVHAENTHLAPGDTAPELVDALGQCIKKRGVPGLLPATHINTEGASEEDIQLAHKLIDENHAGAMAAGIEALDTLQPILDLAYECAVLDGVVVRSFTVEEVIELYGGEEDDDDEGEEWKRGASPEDDD